MKKEPLMNSKLRILHLEDNRKDSELIQSTLIGEGIDCNIVCVETRDDFIYNLEDCEFDMILADYTLPSFDGLSALKIAQEKCPFIPFVFVTGTMGEEKAIEILKSGATDYVLKNNLSRLVPSVMRALREMEEIKERKRAKEALIKEKAFTESALNTLSDIFFVFDMSGRFLRWNRAGNTILGYTDEEISAMRPTDFFSGEDVQRVIEAIQKVIQEGNAEIEASFITKDKRKIPYEVVGSLLKDPDGNYIGICGVGRDITDRKKFEEELRKREEELKNRVKELEDFYEMGVGRELRMIELKKEIESLKEELAKYKKDEG
jgi:PAS domain S-box-containing protein